MTAFHVHHHCDGHTACNPFFGRSGSVAYGRHITGLAVSNQRRCRITQRVAIIGIEVRRSGATSFIAEEVMLCSELAYEFAFFFPLSQFNSNHFGQQFLCLDERYLYVSVRVTIQCQLACNTFGKACIDSGIFRRKFADDIVTLV